MSQCKPVWRSNRAGGKVFSSRKQLCSTQHLSTWTTARVLAKGYLELDQRSWSQEIYLRLEEVALSSVSLECSSVLTSHHLPLITNEKLKSLTTSLVNLSRDNLGQEHPQTRRLVQLQRCQDYWGEVNAGIENPTGPITSTLLDRLVAMSSKILEREAVPEFQEEIAIIRQK